MGAASVWPNIKLGVCTRETNPIYPNPKPIQPTLHILPDLTDTEPGVLDGVNAAKASPAAARSPYLAKHRTVTGGWALH